MIDRTHPLPVRRQCQLLNLARSTAYYQPPPVSEATRALMRRIDELHLQYPFAGARMLRDLLRHEGQTVGRRHVATLMRRMGIEALYRKPSLSRRQPGYQIYPYLLRDLTISRPNQVWAADITYIPLRRGILLPLKLRPPSRHGSERTEEVARWQQKQANRLNGGRPNGAWRWS